MGVTFPGTSMGRGWGDPDVNMGVTFPGTSMGWGDSDVNMGVTFPGTSMGRGWGDPDVNNSMRYTHFNRVVFYFRNVMFVLPC